MFVFDAHIHTLASGHHTTDRVIDVVKAAKSRGILAVGITEHAHGMLNGCTESGFRSLMLSARQAGREGAIRRGSQRNGRGRLD